MDIRITADCSYSYCENVTEIEYGFTRFELFFDEKVKVVLRTEQFENLLKQMISAYTNITGKDETVKLMESIITKEVV